MKWEFELAFGALCIGVGLALVLTLPPPWWPNMTPYLVHVGVFAGTSFLLYGIGLVATALCRRSANGGRSFRYLYWWDMAWASKRRSIGVLVAVVTAVFILPLLFFPAVSQTLSAPPNSGDCSNFGTNNGQIYNNCHNTFNGPVPRRMNQDRAVSLKEQMLTQFQKDKAYNIVSIMGDSEALQFATDILEFLKQNNFKATGVDQAVFTAPVIGLQRQDRPDGTIELIVGAAPN